jgi:hypothetical protein
MSGAQIRPALSWRKLRDGHLSAFAGRKALFDKVSKTSYLSSGKATSVFASFSLYQAPVNILKGIYVIPHHFTVQFGGFLP